MSEPGLPYVVTTFYKFLPLLAEQLPDLKTALQQRAQALDILGLLLLAPEGVNATVVGEPPAIEQYKKFLNDTFGELTYKNSPSHSKPFKRFKVKIKAEIVQLQRTDIQPTGQESHVSPAEWDALVAEQKMIVIDVRNSYETKLGTFKNALNPQTATFSQFPAWLEQADIPKDQTIGIFCTGGIRCEKAAVAMAEQGYANVHQLDGGILNYIEQRPNQNFEGECFVFDHRIAVDQQLKPSQTYGICTTCGNGGGLTRICEECQKPYRICEECVTQVAVALCSKDCRYRYAQKRVQSY